MGYGRGQDLSLPLYASFTVTRGLCRPEPRTVSHGPLRRLKKEIITRPDPWQGTPIEYLRSKMGEFFG